MTRLISQIPVDRKLLLFAIASGLMNQYGKKFS